MTNVSELVLPADPPLTAEPSWATRLAYRAWVPYLAAEFLATHWPGAKLPLPVPKLPWDKLLHFAAFVVLGATIGLSLAARRRAGIVTMLCAWLAIGLYGLFDELTQPLVGRDREWLDWGADLLGAICGLLLVSALARRGWLRTARDAGSPDEI